MKDETLHDDQLLGAFSTLRQLGKQATRLLRLVEMRGEQLDQVRGLEAIARLVESGVNEAIELLAAGDSELPEAYNASPRAMRAIEWVLVEASDDAVLLRRYAEQRAPDAEAAAELRGIADVFARSATVCAELLRIDLPRLRAAAARR